MSSHASSCDDDRADKDTDAAARYPLIQEIAGDGCGTSGGRSPVRGGSQSVSEEGHLEGDVRETILRLSSGGTECAGVGMDIAANGAIVKDSADASEQAPTQGDDQENTSSLKPGDKVRLHSLQAAPHLNSLEATLVRWQESQGRWVVTLCDGEEKALRAENLDLIEAALPMPGTEIATSPAVVPEAMANQHFSANAAEPVVADKSDLFKANLEKLRAKAKAEERGVNTRLPRERKRGIRECGDPSRNGRVGCRGSEGANGHIEQGHTSGGGEHREAHKGRVTHGIGADDGVAYPAAKGRRIDQPDSASKYNVPISFVAQEAAEAPSRKVVIIDPRGGMTAGCGDDSDDEHLAPAAVKIPRTRRSGRLWTQPPAASQPSAAGASLSHAHAANAEQQSVDEVGQPSVYGNRTLNISEAARQGEMAFKTAQEKRKVVEAGKKDMLAKLTKQLQLCLSRLRDSKVDEKGREKYQNLITSIRAQMTKLSSIA
eukprot:TRINITY_DN44508_c0_g1_i1.p1 TRINITY_DN44508_c0_g1~~TRINITY_DN44508_c0_g1_i1.p1  ORF type:complete len:488 (+),score=101.07 TRINITY_DN44508_c0_g1_i1:79-1542(+)